MLGHNVYLHIILTAAIKGCHIQNEMSSSKISEHSSIIAKNAKVRKILKKYQISFARKNKNCCIEGRDIATKILPRSDLKFFFICNLNIASIRRFKELKKNNSNLKLKDVKKEF